MSLRRCALLFIASGSALSWLRVERAFVPTVPPSKNVSRAYLIRDASGREVWLRGANLENEERNLAPPRGLQRPIDASFYNGSCPTNLGDYQEPPLCEVDAGSGKFAQPTSDTSNNDLAQMRALGLNFVRLCLSWSELEPTPGVYSAAYLDRVTQIVGWAAEQDIYVLLDMHEDLYSRSILGNASAAMPPYLTPTDGQDGAPGWAVLSYDWPSVAVNGIGNLNLAMMRAFEAFWTNDIPPNAPVGAAPGPGLQDHYIGAIAVLARRFINEPAVLGIEIMNEPQPGLELDPFSFAQDTLFAFYARVIQAITGVRDGKPTCNGTLPLNNSCAYQDLGIRDTRHIFFCEPSSLRNLFDFAPEEAVPFTSYDQIVYAPHVYTNSFTIWSPPSYDFAYQTATAEAAGRKGALVITEFGGALSDAAVKVGPTLTGQENYLASGSSIWAWKSNCAGPSCNQSAWTVYDPFPSNGSGPLPEQSAALRPFIERILSRPHPRGVCGDVLSVSYNATGDRAFLLTANISSAAPGCISELYIPRSLLGSNVSVAGAAALNNTVTWPDGSRTAYVGLLPTPGGAYAIALSPLRGEEGEGQGDYGLNGPVLADSGALAAAQASSATAPLSSGLAWGPGGTAAELRNAAGEDAGDGSAQQAALLLPQSVLAEIASACDAVARELGAARTAGSGSEALASYAAAMKGVQRVARALGLEWRE